MEVVFADTNIALDLLAQRDPFYIHAARLFSLADKKAVGISISSLSFNNLNYMLSKQYNRAASKRILTQFKRLVTVLPVDDRIVNLALTSTFPDFEDALQYFCAIEHNLPVIITRNIKDFKESAIPVMTAEIYLKGLSDL